MSRMDGVPANQQMVIRARKARVLARAAMQQERERILQQAKEKSLADVASEILAIAKLSQEATPFARETAKTRVEVSRDAVDSALLPDGLPESYE